MQQAAAVKLPASFLSCGMGCGHTKLLVNVARNDISELGFNQTLISRVAVNYYCFMTKCHFICFLLYTRTLLVNHDK